MVRAVCEYIGFDESVAALFSAYISGWHDVGSGDGGWGWLSLERDKVNTIGVVSAANESNWGGLVQADCALFKSGREAVVAELANGE